MKNIFKWISYILLPIFFLNFIVSIGYLIIQENNKTVLDDSNENNLILFMDTYMLELSNLTNELIFYNDGYSNIKDNEITICYFGSGYTGRVNLGVEDLNFLIIYKDKALTNLELTTDTDTIDEIKALIDNSELKKTSIINGEVRSDTELLEKKAVQYFDNFNFRYYKTEKTETTYQVGFEDDEDFESEVNYSTNYNTDEIVQKIYYNTSISDFEIYTSYNEQVVERYNAERQIFEIVKDFGDYSNICYVMIPVNIILFILTLIYLTWAIGGKEVKLNSLDKMFFELVGFIAVMLGGMSFVPLIIASEEIHNDLDGAKLILVLLFSTYFINYIMQIILYTTFVKRIKAKSFWKTTLFGKVLIFAEKILNKSIHKIKESKNNLRIITSKKKKAIIYFLGFLLLEIILVLLFNWLGFFIDIILLIFMSIKLTKIVSSYEKMERKLKDMYQGENKINLDLDELDDNLKEAGLYVNDIASGFENAIQNSIKSERLKTELITNVSHDIKTPLTSIINYVDLLKQEKIEHEKAKEYMDILDSKSQRLKKLIDDLLEASKASTGAIKLNLGKINIIELLNQAIGEFEDKFHSKDLEIIKGFDNNEILINADSRYLYRVIENLFSNISKYTLEKSRVYIDLTEEERTIKISIKNISKERLNISSDELMQRFVRGDKSRTTEGSGLGISIAKSLTELQGGVFELEIDGDLFKVEIVFDKIE